MTIGSLRLATRLSLAFGFVVLLSLCASGFALVKLGSIQHGLATVVTDNNERIRLNQRMSESVHIVSRVMRTVVLLRDAAARQEESKKIAARRADYDEARAALEKFTPSAQARPLRAAIDAAASKARALNNRVIELGLAGEAERATELLMREAAPATQAWQDALDKNIEFQEQHNQTDFRAATADYESARRILIAAALASALLALGLSVAVVRSVVGELGGEPADVATLARTVADSDLTTAIVVRANDTRSIVAGMARMQTSLAAIVQAVRGNAESVATASAQIAQGNADLSSRTEEQASALQQTAASMEQLGATVRQNADNARQANQLALGASGVATRGGEVFAQVVNTMKNINDSSKRVVEIIGVIDGIAFQTNILALNAAVEAARAGEQGRGFAVVASEVRSLARRSAAAAKEIKGLISQSVERADEGTALVDRAGETMTEIVAAIQRVTDIVGEISAASTEQATGVAQVGEAVSQMDQATQQNSALVEESAAAAESLRAQAEALVSAVAVFRLSGSAPSAVSAGAVTPKPPQRVSAARALPRPAAERVRNLASPDTPRAVTRTPMPAGAAAEWETF